VLGLLGYAAGAVAMTLAQELIAIVIFCRGGWRSRSRPS
jgi:hypothetical protein